MTHYSLIFEGGGIKGIAHVGALKFISETGLYSNIKFVAGSSAGSQIATLFAAGLCHLEIREIFQIHHIADSSCFRNFNISKYRSFKSNLLERYMNKILKRKFNIDKITFGELFKKTGIHLKITGTCISDQTFAWFDYQITPFMEVAKAVRISSCIPLHYQDKYYVDGGLIRSLPSDAFPNTKPIILEFEESNSNSFATSVLNTMLGNVYRSPIGECIHVIIPTGHISATDFNINDDDKCLFYYAGYTSIKNAFELTDMTLYYNKKSSMSNGTYI